MLGLAWADPRANAQYAEQSKQHFDTSLWRFEATFLFEPECAHAQHIVMLHGFYMQAAKILNVFAIEVEWYACLSLEPEPT